MLKLIFWFVQMMNKYVITNISIVPMLKRRCIFVRICDLTRIDLITAAAAFVVLWYSFLLIKMLWKRKKLKQDTERKPYEMQQLKCIIALYTCIWSVCFPVHPCYIQNVIHNHCAYYITKYNQIRMAGKIYLLQSVSG